MLTHVTGEKCIASIWRQSCRVVGSLTPGVSERGDRLGKLAALYDQCEYALSYKYSFGKGKAIRYADFSLIDAY